jgi:hypothetical protein
MTTVCECEKTVVLQTTTSGQRSSSGRSTSLTEGPTKAPRMTAPQQYVTRVPFDSGTQRDQANILDADHCLTGTRADQTAIGCRGGLRRLEARR